MNKKLLDATEVAELFGLTKDRVYALVRENILPSVRVGRQIRFDPEKLQKWIDDGGRAYDGGWKREA